jgi:hypothetical protein
MIMAVIESQETIDVLLANDGIYPGDELMPVVRIVQYMTPEGAQVYGIVYAVEVHMGLLHRYDQETEYIRNPVVIFSREAS